MRYLVTGGAGFIGSHLADLLAGRGETVILLDDVSTGRIENVRHLLEGEHADRVKLQEGSVLDFELLDALIGQVDVVAHLAASVGVQLIVKQPLKSLLNNIRGTEIVLDVAARHGAKVLITSTSEIYGKNSTGPLSEESDRVLGSPFKARWAYSTSKAVDEILAHHYWRELALPTVVARLFNCAGPRQSGVHGMVIPRFVQQALSGEDLTVYGDGTQSRSFCSVGDVVIALARLMDTPAAVGEVFNIGSQNEITILALADLVIELTGSSSGVRFVPYEDAYEPGFEDMERRVPDVGKILRATGWAPRQSVRDIVQSVISHELERAVGASIA